MFARSKSEKNELIQPGGKQPAPDASLVCKAESDNNRSFINDSQIEQPFSLSFRQSFNWENDAIYGFSNPRTKYIAEVMQDTVHQEEPTADFYNHWIVPETVAQATETMPPKVIEYQRFLEKHPVAKYQQLAKREIMSVDERRRALARSCKARVQDVAQHGGTVHFVMDDSEHPWDMQAVVKKESVVRNLISVKELRFIYKHRKELVGHIQFWKKGKKVQPPWEEEPQIWAQFRSGKG
ncbi:MAG: hypothetical protein A3E83_04580 [Gammaproteobacteria bacterium RIFCSPHIGHO2_12_FULL_41_20]|nr:MAG: hypothetical protein A3E83_04580 [Gammaproteobacteria bacterium RIFCSPHIGHO2_12_FULL_41_20]